MKTMSLLSAVALLGTGCASALGSYAGVEYRNAKGHVNGYTETPEMSIAAISEATVEEMYAETYREAVREGKAYAYQGGGRGGDFGYYFGDIEPYYDGRMPARGSEKPGKKSGEFATKAELKAVNAKADDSIRMHKKLKVQLDGSQPSGE